MLRVHLMQNWFGLSDPAMEAVLNEVTPMRAFARLTLTKAIPDETTILNFRHLLEANELAPEILSRVNACLSRKGLMLKRGSIVDATIIAAPSSTKNAEGERDPERHQTKKGNQWHFGMKAHIGVDADSGLVHTVTTTPANEADVEVVDELLHEREAVVHADSCYTGADNRVRRKRRRDLEAKGWSRDPKAAIQTPTTPATAGAPLTNRPLSSLIGPSLVPVSASREYPDNRIEGRDHGESLGTRVLRELRLDDHSGVDADRVFPRGYCCSGRQQCVFQTPPSVQFPVGGTLDPCQLTRCDLRHHIRGLDQSGEFAISEVAKGCDNRTQVGVQFEEELMARNILDEAHIHPAIRGTIANFHADIVREVQAAITAADVVVVGMRQNPFPKRARKALHAASVPFRYLEYGSYLRDWRRRNALKMWTGWPTFPMIFVKGVLIGGAADLERLIQSGELKLMLIGKSVAS